MATASSPTTRTPAGAAIHRQMGLVCSECRASCYNNKYRRAGSVRNPSPQPPPRNGEGEQDQHSLFFSPSPLRGGGRGLGGGVPHAPGSPLKPVVGPSLMSTSAVGTTPVAHDTQSSMNGQTDSHLAPLKEVIDHAAHLLPAQGPITVFIHHNTLHAFEDLPFTDAVKKAAKIFGCQPYLTEDRYREKLGHGRIRFADLQAVLQEDLGPRADAKVLRLCTRLE